MRLGEKTFIRDIGGGGVLKPTIRQKANLGVTRTSGDALADVPNLSKPQFRHPDNGYRINYIPGLNVITYMEQLAQCQSILF